MSVNVYNKNTGNLTNIAGGSSVNNLNNLVPSDTKETSIIATKPHTEGDYFEVNGSFVKAIDDITIGDTLTEGTNYKTTNVGAELTDIESDLSTVSSNLSTVSSNLGNKSSASAVSGSTAFAKINTLNNEVTDLNASLTWKYLGTFNSGETYDSVAHDIPTDAKEMTFIFKYGILEIVVYANVDDMKATTATHDYPQILNGWYSTPTNNGSGAIQHSSSKFGISNFVYAGANTIAPCTVYYR